MKKITFWQKMLIVLGFRSKCCYASITYSDTWNRSYCDNCNSRLS